MEPTEEKMQEQVAEKSNGLRGEGFIERITTSKAGLSKFTIAVISVLAVVVLADVAFILIRPDAGRGDQGFNLETAVALPNAEHQPDPERYASSNGGRQPAAVQPSPSTTIQATGATQTEDSRIEALAVEKISEDQELGSVVTTVRDSRVVLSGTVGSANAKTRAGELAKAVQGVKSVDNKIVVQRPR